MLFSDPVYKKSLKELMVVISFAENRMLLIIDIKDSSCHMAWARSKDKFQISVQLGSTILKRNINLYNKGNLEKMKEDLKLFQTVLENLTKTLPQRPRYGKNMNDVMNDLMRKYIPTEMSKKNILLQ